jgi:hypothetical protein
MRSQTAIRRFTLGELVALSLALVFSAGFVVAALTAPFYQSDTAGETPDGHLIEQASSSATLVEENGLHVLVIVAVPLLLSVAVGVVLGIRAGDRGAGLAWLLVVTLGLLALAGMLTIGPLLLPTTACLLIACAIRDGRRTARTATETAN